MPHGIGPGQKQPSGPEEQEDKPIAGAEDEDGKLVKQFGPQHSSRLQVPDGGGSLY